MYGHSVHEKKTGLDIICAFITVTRIAEGHFVHHHHRTSSNNKKVEPSAQLDSLSLDVKLGNCIETVNTLQDKIKK